eukprot:scaffold1927_cov333-Pavlova_lutheri.AAC.14
MDPVQLLLRIHTDASGRRTAGSKVWREAGAQLRRDVVERVHLHHTVRLPAIDLRPAPSQVPDGIGRRNGLSLCVSRPVQICTAGGEVQVLCRRARRCHDGDCVFLPHGSPLVWILRMGVGVLLVRNLGFCVELLLDVDRSGRLRYGTIRGSGRQHAL